MEQDAGGALTPHRRLRSQDRNSILLSLSQFLRHPSLLSSLRFPCHPFASFSVILSEAKDLLL
jgi:hypothetical protein